MRNKKGKTPKNNQSLVYTLLILPVLCAGLAFTIFAEDCEETVVIDDVEYTLPDPWCGQALDSTDIAEPSQLVRLPDELTFEDYRIYVLPETRDAFVKMAEAAKKDSIDLIADSGFRSPGFQLRIIKRRLERGDSIDDIFHSVAPPGYSQHHTGLALDLCPSEARFAYSDTYRWLKENAAGFGFVESMPEDRTGGSPWESWHWYYSVK